MQYSIKTCKHKIVFSQAILADKTLYVSGLLGMDPQGQLVCGGAAAQTKQALDNLKHVLAAGGSSLEAVVKTTILLASMDDFQDVNQVYAQCKYRYFNHNDAPHSVELCTNRMKHSDLQVP